MKICAIGDPHGEMSKLKKIPMKGVEAILINGDCGKANFARERFFENKKREKEGLLTLEYTGKDMKVSQMEIFNSTLGVWKYFSNLAPTYTISGNVGHGMLSDAMVRKDEKKYNIKLPSLRQAIDKIEDFNFVRNRVRNIEGLRVGFLENFTDKCWIKEYDIRGKKKLEKAKKATVKAKRILNNFESLDILICHQPPYGYLDMTNNPAAPKDWKGKHAGSKVILDYIKKFQPKYVFCGHIHESEGHVRIGKTEVYNLGVAGYKIIEL